MTFILIIPNKSILPYQRCNLTLQWYLRNAPRYLLRRFQLFACLFVIQGWRIHHSLHSPILWPIRHFSNNVFIVYSFKANKILSSGGFPIIYRRLIPSVPDARNFLTTLERQMPGFSGIKLRHRCDINYIRVPLNI